MFVGDHPMTRQTDRPCWAVSFPSSSTRYAPDPHCLMLPDLQQQTADRLPAREPAITMQLNAKGKPEKFGSGGSSYDDCLPAKMPVISKLQAEGCKQSWEAQAIGLLSDGGKPWFLGGAGLCKEHFLVSIETRTSWELFVPVSDTKFKVSRIDILEELGGRGTHAAIIVDSSSIMNENVVIPLYKKHICCKLTISFCQPELQDVDCIAYAAGAGDKKQQGAKWKLDASDGEIHVLGPLKAAHIQAAAGPAGNTAVRQWVRGAGVKAASPAQQPTPMGAKYTLVDPAGAITRSPWPSWPCHCPENGGMGP